MVNCLFFFSSEMFRRHFFTTLFFYTIFTSTHFYLFPAVSCQHFSVCFNTSAITTQPYLISRLMQVIVICVRETENCDWITQDVTLPETDRCGYHVTPTQHAQVYPCHHLLLSAYRTLCLIMETL